MRAIELYLRYDRSAAAVINELGYPNRQTLRLWYMEFAENGGLSRGRHRRYDDLQKRAAVDHFFDHGQCLARTARQLGYPKSKELLASWVDELESRSRRSASAASRTWSSRCASWATRRTGMSYYSRQPAETSISRHTFCPSGRVVSLEFYNKNGR